MRKFQGVFILSKIGVAGVNGITFPFDRGETNAYERYLLIKNTWRIL
jgi:hypothetical protein